MSIFIHQLGIWKYLLVDDIIESKLHTAFVEKGGKPQRQTPFYMVMGECIECKLWFVNSEIITIPIDEFDRESISFTYGDSFPTFDPTHGDNQEYRQKVYTYDEIWNIIKKYGMPQDKPWTEDAPYWQVNYVEAQIWSDKVINKYR